MIFFSQFENVISISGCSECLGPVEQAGGQELLLKTSCLASFTYAIKNHGF